MRSGCRARGERPSADRTAERGNEFPSCEVDRHRTLGGVKRIARPNRHISDRLHRGPIAKRIAVFLRCEMSLTGPTADISGSFML